MQSCNWETLDAVHLSVPLRLQLSKMGTKISQVTDRALVSEELKSHFDSLHSKFEALYVTIFIYMVLQ